VLTHRGLSFFLQPGPRGPARLDSRRIAWVVEAARRGANSCHRDPNALTRTRRVVRRELIRRMAEVLVETGM